MDPPPAIIRPFQPKDDKPVRFLIGKGQMESLAVANRRGALAPSTSLQIDSVLHSIFTPHWTIRLGRALLYICAVYELVAETR